MVNLPAFSDLKLRLRNSYLTATFLQDVPSFVEHLNQKKYQTDVAGLLAEAEAVLSALYSLAEAKPLLRSRKGVKVFVFPEKTGTSSIVYSATANGLIVDTKGNTYDIKEIHLDDAIDILFQIDTIFNGNDVLEGQKEY